MRCHVRILGVICLADIPADRRLCDECLNRGHLAGCKSPAEECSCGFSELFWEDVKARGGVEMKFDSGGSIHGGSLRSARKGGRGESPEPLSGRLLEGEHSASAPASDESTTAEYGTQPSPSAQPETQLESSAPLLAEFGVNSVCTLCNGVGWTFVETSVGRRAKRCECRKVEKSGKPAPEIVQPDFKSLAAGEL